MFCMLDNLDDNFKKKKSKPVLKQKKTKTIKDKDGNSVGEETTIKLKGNGWDKRIIDFVNNDDTFKVHKEYYHYTSDNKN